MAVVAAALAAAGGAEVHAPVGAGRFYPARGKDLAALAEEQLARAPAEALPPGAAVLAVLVPHAGLEFSGPTAARAFKPLKKGAYDAVIVVGTSHYKELEGAALYPGPYATSEGAMPYARTLAQALLKATPLIKADASAHKKEHSIEVELPFIRHALGTLPVAALVMNTEDLEASRRVGRALAAAAKGGRVLLVASSDQSHFPAGGIGDAVDRTTLEALKTLDPAYFWLTNRFLMNRALPHLAVTYCGEGAVTAVLEAARLLGADKVRVLAHINSGDVVSEREYNHVVGYASALFTRERGQAPSRPALAEKQKRQLLDMAHASALASETGKQAAVPLSADPVMNLPAAVFVTLRRPDGSPAAMAGSAEPQESLLEAVARQAAAAGTAAKAADANLSLLRAEVSVLGPLHAATPADISAGQGARLEKDGQVGVLLPGAWKDFPKKDDFLGQLCEKKAGLPRGCWKDASAELKTFGADTFGD
jgi:AmmeMemoRadiSam system protein B